MKYMRQENVLSLIFFINLNENYIFMLRCPDAKVCTVFYTMHSIVSIVRILLYEGSRILPIYINTVICAKSIFKRLPLSYLPYLFLYYTALADASHRHIGTQRFHL